MNDFFEEKSGTRYKYFANMQINLRTLIAFWPSSDYLENKYLKFQKKRRKKNLLIHGQITIEMQTKKILTINRKFTYNSSPSVESAFCMKFLRKGELLGDTLNLTEPLLPFVELPVFDETSRLKLLMPLAGTAIVFIFTIFFYLFRANEQ